MGDSRAVTKLIELFLGGPPPIYDESIIIIIISLSSDLTTHGTTSHVPQETGTQDVRRLSLGGFLVPAVPFNPPPPTLEEGEGEADDLHALADHCYSLLACGITKDIVVAGTA